MGTGKNLLIYPFSCIYRIITDIRNLFYDTGILKSEEFPFPVICIGNITVGGTGKTPHAEYIIDLLRNDFRVALISRGYKRRSKGYRIVTPDSHVTETGDEPLQISRKFPEVIVAVDKDRVKGIRTIMKIHPETDVIIMDDGFQHRRVKPGLSILLTDYARLITRDYLLPYGRLREKRSNRKRADVILVTKTPEEITDSERDAIREKLLMRTGQKLFFTSLEYKDPLPVFEVPGTGIKSFKVLNRETCGAVLVTGISSPGPLKKHLTKYFASIIHLEFPDHHYFGKNNIAKIWEAWRKLPQVNKMVITTEKDAVRLREFANIDDTFRRSFSYLPVGIGILNDARKEFNNLISDYVGENKRNG